ncbi:MAG: oxygen-independent coproporphyrinogen III oxidase [Pseudomonadota bacterium]|nr:oxygen-independent coproporphyrinogen III oxidase [Pseudomonadota bacterium]
MISPVTFAKYARMRVPRYTSYPTAPNFRSEVGAGEYREWLGALQADVPVSLYLHIPFCQAMCWYCGCHTSVTRRPEPIARYVNALLTEIEAVAAIAPGRMTVSHLHWGGGSPTVLAPDDIKRIDRTLRHAFRFAPDAELAVEVDPRTLSGAVASAFAASGVNRVSVGVQSFDPAVQKAINRVQSVAQTASAVRMFRRRGVEAINFDLIYGLPHQTVASCVETVVQALAMRPNRLAVFGYAHVPSFKPHQRNIDQAVLPDPLERHRQAEVIADTLTDAGYVRIGLDHFALPGDSLTAAAAVRRLHRNFQGYTTDSSTTLIGFGASAIGRLPLGFVQNETNLPAYQRTIARGELATSRGCPVSSEDLRRAAIIEHLMCDYRADAGDLLPVAVGELERDGLIRRSGTLIEVTDEGRPLVRAVAAAFDAYLPHTPVRHVTAV